MSEYGTVGGVPVTDADVAAMVANAEAGFPGVTMRRDRPGRPLLGTGPSRTVAVRLDPELAAALATRQRESGLTTSELIREALSAYLAA
ncbi:ribbon-helix-helix domain-containing protein [Cutibacterium equinum]|uniref:Ribbon-helix-helix domain-containing protein n=1 Tax=Cutibacterium equinum TaxID=3016342 RepID=A0ABY7QZP9_9ACTN|nr:CopG family transcriptional regulator [Cutibacterium equinum]WCC80165.1 ribbon-helix-helix domain-containing protein [Cutibacterium equinum]